MSKSWNIFAASVGSVLAVILLGSAAGADDVRWSTGTYSDDANDGRRTAYLSHGIPETDDVRFNAVCSAGPSGDTAPATLGYNTGTLREGARVNVHFFVDGRQVYQKPGRVHGTKREEGVSGVQFRPSFHDYFWQVLSRGGSLGYRIEGREMATISLAGSAGPIREFTETCKAIHDGSFRQPGGGSQGPRTRSCDELGRLKSRNSNAPLTLTFTNRTSGYRAVLWLDYQGRPVDYAGLNAGQTHVQQTFAGHPWMFTDGPGNCKEIYVPESGDSRFDITAE